MISWSSLNVGHVEWKTRALGQICSKPFYPLEATVLLQSLKLLFTRMFLLVISRSSSNMGHVGSKTRSLGQMSLKPLFTRGYSFVLIFMELYQKVCFDDISVKFEYGPCWVKSRSLGQFCLKPCSPSRGLGFASILIFLYQNVCLDDILVKFEFGSGWVKSQKLGH